MAGKPSVVPTWSTIGTRTSPAGSAAAGFVAGNRFPAEWANYLLGYLSDWAAYLDGQSFVGDLAITGDFTAAGSIVSPGFGVLGEFVQTARADILHDDRTMILDGLQPFSGWAYAGSGEFTLAASGLGVLEAVIPLSVGDRLKSVRVMCRAEGGAASDISVRVTKVTAASGGTSVSSADQTSTHNSTATANKQAVVADVAGFTSVTALAADEHLYVYIQGANTSGIKHVYRVEAVFDRVA